MKRYKIIYGYKFWRKGFFLPQPMYFGDFGGLSKYPCFTKPQSPDWNAKQSRIKAEFNIMFASKVNRLPLSFYRPLDLQVIQKFMICWSNRGQENCLFISYFTIRTLFKNYSKCRMWVFGNLAFSTNFFPIKTNMSGNTVCPQASGFQKLAKMDHFWYFRLTFVYSKCKRSSLRSHCWMRVFLWFSNTVDP